MSVVARGRSPRDSERARGASERSEDDGWGGSWHEIKTEGWSAYATHHRSRSGNSTRLHPVSATETRP
jgi:hypothetical protein